MRAVVIVLLSVGGVWWAVDSNWAQTPAPAPPPRPTQAAPAPARRPPAPPTRAGLTVTVTDPLGTGLGGVRVEVLGASDRRDVTNATGQVSFTGIQPGVYRLRFNGERVITFEKEVTVRGGQVTDIDVTLNPAPPPPPPPPPPPAPAPARPPAPVVGPPGMPRTVSIIGLLEKELIPGNQPRRETPIACSGNMRTTLVQLNQEQPERLYDTAEVTYYVVAGEGAVSINGRETMLAAGAFVSVPRGTGHALIRRGRRPFILMATLTGVPCEEPR